MEESHKNETSNIDKNDLDRKFNYNFYNYLNI